MEIRDAQDLHEQLRRSESNMCTPSLSGCNELLLLLSGILETQQNLL